MAPSKSSQQKASAQEKTNNAYLYLFIVTLLMFFGFIMVYVSFRVETEATVRRLAVLSDRVEQTNGHLRSLMLRSAAQPSVAVSPTNDIASSSTDSRILATSPDGVFVLRGMGMCNMGPFTISDPQKIVDPQSGVAYRMYNLGYGLPESQDLGAVVRSTSDTASGLEITYPNVAFQRSGMMYRYMFNQYPGNCSLSVSQK